MREASDIERKLWERELSQDENFLSLDGFGEFYPGDALEDMLEEVDRQLKPHQLEVVYYKTDDGLTWKIEKRHEDKSRTLVRSSWGEAEDTLG